MLHVIFERLRQKRRTVAFPAAAPSLPDRFRGLPEVRPERCAGASCSRCLEACPTGAVSLDSGLALDLGRCVFCAECERACASSAIRFTPGFELAARASTDLVLSGQVLRRCEALDARMRKLFGRALRLRQVSAGGCNACEADANVLTTVVFDLSRFGIDFVASPRHADGLYVTGPVTRNMRLALDKTFAAVPEPKLVIAAGACAISGGLFRDLPEAGPGLEGLLPADLFIPGCPPHPYTALDGLLKLLGRI